MKEFIGVGLAVLGLSSGLCSAFAADLDLDGVESSIDCDDDDETVGSMLQQRDEDADGFGKTVRSAQIALGGNGWLAPEVGCYLNVGGIECFGANLGQISSASLSGQGEGWVEISMGSTVGAARAFDSDELTFFGDTSHSIARGYSPASEGTAQFDLGTADACEVTNYGSLVCWGDDDSGIVSAMPANGPYTMVQVGSNHACALDDSGAVECWGTDSSDQIGGAPTDSLYVDLVVGMEHSVALHRSGSIVCWGKAEYCMGVPNSTAYVEIFGGPFGTCALDGDGGLSCWGDLEIERDVPGGTGYHGGAVGLYAACVLDRSDNVVCWGMESSSAELLLDSAPILSSCDFTRTELALYPDDCDDQDWMQTGIDVHYLDQDGDTEGHAGNFESFAIGGDALCAVNSESRVQCWGDPSSALIVDAPQNKGWTQVVAFSSVSGSDVVDNICGIRADGGGACWGALFGVGSNPVTVIDAVSLFARGALACWMNSIGELSCVGDDSAGQISSAPQGSAISGLQANPAGDTACALDSGYPVCWGSDDWFIVYYAGIQGSFESLAVGEHFACGLTAFGEIECWGLDPYTFADPLPPNEASGNLKIVASTNVVCALESGGSISCSGPQQHLEVDLAPRGSDFIDLWSWKDGFCAETLDGGLTCWGSGLFEGGIPMLGTVDLLTGVEDVRVAHTAAGCALDEMGTLVCWKGAGQGTVQTQAPAMFSCASLLQTHSLSNLDECDENPATFEPYTWYDDFDFDGFGDENPEWQGVFCDVPGPGDVANSGAGFSNPVDIGGDCLDYWPGIDSAIASNTFPGSAELDSTTECMVDVDGDGYGESNATVNYPDQVAWGLVNGNDCDDADATILNAGAMVYYLDGDGDGFGDSGDVGLVFCSDPGAGYSTDNTDCDDAAVLVSPDGEESCNGLEDDCNGVADDGLLFTDYFVDVDGDGFGDSDDSGESFCSDPGAGYALDASDCDDSDDLVNPDQPEECNGVDDDCNGVVDNGFTFVDYFLDNDGDGYGDGSQAAVAYCADPGPGYATNDLDCDDDDLALNGDDIDLDGYTSCDGDCDDDDSNMNPDTVWYLDGDGDGDGSLLSDATYEVQCESPGADYTLDSSDCDDTDDTLNRSTVWYKDVDSDGYGDTATSRIQCEEPSTAADWSRTAGDCDDSDSLVFPGATEVCDGVDNDCNQSVDEGVGTTFYRDLDGDGYGDASDSKVDCSGGGDWVRDDSDCDDDDALIFRAMTKSAMAVTTTAMVTWTTTTLPSIF